ncbi:hypothetical protein BGAL_0156g00120 [Botrytis galanthina]|uniref:Uncharacterized protein n=1 Tax=Botrytis galanthina TaxID=278940 RepID=A0A4S8RAD7_9HELO|nr:hypothetical protein BGAL_0156g00120 [Botrytis galanthina]
MAKQPYYPQLAFFCTDSKYGVMNDSVDNPSILPYKLRWLLYIRIPKWHFTRFSSLNMSVA